MWDHLCNTINPLSREELEKVYNVHRLATNKMEVVKVADDD